MGYEVVREIEKGNSPKIYNAYDFENEEDLFGAITAGADGYLLKNAEPEELRKAIILVSQGMAVFTANDP